MIVDPEIVAEGSGYKLAMKGLPHAIVNGELVKWDGKAANVMAGHFLSKPGPICSTTSRCFTIANGATVTLAT
jgi:hypothetical protein